MENNRLTKLDGVRGILSLLVALNHSFLIFTIPVLADIWQKNIFQPTDIQIKLQQLFMLLGNGGAAVSLFFVLSGLVVGMSLDRKWIGMSGLPKFYLKRLIRLYPVYGFLVIATSIYIVSGFKYEIFPQASAWYNWWMNFEMSIPEFIRNMLFVHTYIGGVTWTLRVIIVASLMMPFLFILSRKTSKWLDIPITYALHYLAFYVFTFTDFRDFKYIYMFYLGISIPKWKDIFAFPKQTIITYPIAIFLIYEFLQYRYLTNEYKGGVIESLISWLILGIIVYNSKITILNFLNAKIFQFYGKISYSLYLVHFSVLYLLARFLFIYFPTVLYTSHYFISHLLMFMVSTLIATPISYLVYKYIEEPSGRLLSHK